jgi:protocatechuate 3,4-dioxygenase beta subunit
MTTSSTSTTSSTDHDDFGGLGRDLPKLIDRRRALHWMGGVSLAGVLAACGSSDDSSSGEASDAASDSNADQTSSSQAGTSQASGSQDTSAAGTAQTDTSATATAGAEIPDETAGPYPADGSNGPNLLDVDGVVRSDMTTSIGDLSGTAEGVPTTIELSIVDADTGAALPGAAVYLWHCTAGGQYSIYEIDDQNYLRAVQTADDSGRLSFTTIFPGCYRGRWPHCHFEVYDSLDVATAGNQATKTSQLALPEAACETIYADARYGDSARNLGELSLATDGVFADGWTDQLATVSGDGSDQVTVSLLVRV